MMVVDFHGQRRLVKNNNALPVVAKRSRQIPSRTYHACIHCTHTCNELAGDLWLQGKIDHRTGGPTTTRVRTSTCTMGTYQVVRTYHGTYTCTYAVHVYVCMYNKSATCHPHAAWYSSTYTCTMVHVYVRTMVL
jgi:hypothetical protein